MRTTTELLRLRHAKYLKPSVYGNPRWAFRAETHTGVLLHFRTASDVGSCYACDLSRLKSATIIRVSHHETRAGNLIARRWVGSHSAGDDLTAQFKAQAEASELLRITPAAPRLDTTKRL